MNRARPMAAQLIKNWACAKKHTQADKQYRHVLNHETLPLNQFDFQRKFVFAHGLHRLANQEKMHQFVGTSRGRVWGVHTPPHP